MDQKIESNERLNVKITYEVTGGKEKGYTETAEWSGIKMDKVGLIMQLLQEAKAKFIQQASSV